MCFVPFGLYIILKRGGHTSGCPPGSSTRKLWLLRLTLYRVPLCQTGSHLQRVLAHPFAARCCVMLQDDLAHLFVAHRRTRCKKPPILSPTIVLPIFLSRTVLFRTRRNVRASSVAVVPSSRRYPYSIVVLYGRRACFSCSSP